MINAILLEILKRKVESGEVKVEDIKDEEYKNAVIVRDNNANTRI